MGVFVRDGALKIVAVVALGSLAGNVWFYCELKAERRHVAEALAAAGAVNHAQYRDDSQQFVEGEHGFNRQRPATQYVGRSMKPAVSTTPEIPDQDSLHSKTIEECIRLVDLAQAERLRDPAQREKIKNGIVQAQKMVSMFDYGDRDVGKAIGLNTEQMNRLYEVLAEQRVQAMERGVVSITASSEITSGTAAPTQYAVIAAEFGDDVARKWTDYRKNVVGRQMTYTLAAVLTDADAPLTAAQRQRLSELYTKVYTDVAKAQPDTEVRSTGALVSGALTDLDQQSDRREMTIQRRFEEEATSFLTEKQLATLRSYDERTLQQKRALRQSEGTNTALHGSSEVSRAVPPC